ncbi:MAG TPA: ABC transporter ATP-binding protein, partial [bacterium]|nr:ABC transporter ATP-binding protein [bacterium]
HYMDEAEQCGRIALMRDGRIIALNSPAALKKSAFPEPLWELSPQPHAPRGWARGLEKDGAVRSLSPHGLRYHAVAGAPRAWSAALRRLQGKVKVRRIPPSLEDVFIRLVEGKQ